MCNGNSFCAICAMVDAPLYADDSWYNGNGENAKTIEDYSEVMVDYCPFCFKIANDEETFKNHILVCNHPDALINKNTNTKNSDSNRNRRRNRNRRNRNKNKKNNKN